MSRNRTVPDKVSDWLMAYRAISAEVTPQPLRTMLSTLQVGEATTPGEAISLLRSSMDLARLISANDRMAAMAAAMLTTSGSARPIPLEDEEV